MNETEDIQAYAETMRHVTLPSASRARIAHALLDYARFHGVIDDVRAKEDSRFIGQVPKGTSVLSRLCNPHYMTLALILALLVGGGTSYAAEGALPGDMLYPVKIGINEKVESALAISDKAEAALQARLVDERLKEAETLAARGELNAEVSQDLETRVKAHYEKAEAHNAEAEADGEYESAARVRASLEGGLRAHAEMIAALNASVSGNDGEALVEDVRGLAHLVAEAHAQTDAANSPVGLEIVAKATVDAGDTLLAEVRAMLADAKEKLSADVYARAEASLEAASSSEARARASLEARAYEEAHTAARTALRMATQVDIAIKSALRLESNNGSSADALLRGVLNTHLGAATETRTEEQSEVRAESASEDAHDDADDDAQAQREDHSVSGGVKAGVSVKTGATLDTKNLEAKQKAGASLETELDL